MAIIHERMYVISLAAHRFRILPVFLIQQERSSGTIKASHCRHPRATPDTIVSRGPLTPVTPHILPVAIRLQMLPEVSDILDMAVVPVRDAFERKHRGASLGCDGTDRIQFVCE